MSPTAASDPHQQRPHRPRTQRPSDTTDDFILAGASPRPLIEPGTYEAVTTAVARKNFWNRFYLEITFTIFKGAIADGEVLATGVPGYFNMGDGKVVPGPGSGLVRLIQLVDPNARPNTIRGSDLKAKAFRVEVVTVTTSNKGGALSEENKYSKVNRVIERLA